MQVLTFCCFFPWIDQIYLARYSPITMSHLTAAITLVPQPRTTFDFRVCGLSKESFTLSKVGDSLRSPSFTAAGCEWDVRVYPGGYNAPAAGHVSIFIGRLLGPADNKVVEVLHTINCADIDTTADAQAGGDTPRSASRAAAGN